MTLASALTAHIAGPSLTGQALSWAGSAVAAAAVLSGVAVLMAAAPPPGESRGQIVAPVVLTLVGPEAVAAIPTPPPQVASVAPMAPDAPTAGLPAPALPAPALPAPALSSPALPAPALPAPALPAPALSAETPPFANAAPRMPSVLAATDAPAVADAPPPAQTIPVPQTARKAEPRPITGPLSPAETPAAPQAAPPANPPQTADAPKPAPRTKSKAEPAPDAVAASTAGDGGKTAKATRTDGVRGGTAEAKAAEKRWGSAIRKRIEAKKAYPAAAMGAVGTVTVRLTVSRTGQLLGVAVTASSGVAALDRAAIKAVQSARFPKAPDAIAGDSASFTLPMKFTG